MNVIKNVEVSNKVMGNGDTSVINVKIVAVILTA